ncbi:MAG TPA: hypothetical protein VF412_11785 [Bdellovibrio sp.]
MYKIKEGDFLSQCLGINCRQVDLDRINGCLNQVIDEVSLGISWSLTLMQ